MLQLENEEEWCCMDSGQSIEGAGQCAAGPGVDSLNGTVVFSPQSRSKKPPLESKQEAWTLDSKQNGLDREENRQDW